jgi:hypothetical protein
VFFDKKSVVDSSMQLHVKLHKLHTMLSFRCVREPIASGMIGYHFVPGERNLADILSKHLGYAQTWLLLKIEDSLVLERGFGRYRRSGHHCCRQKRSVNFSLGMDARIV